MTWTWFGTDES